MNLPANRSNRATFKDHLTLILGFLALLWGIEIADAFVFHGELKQWGIRPRTMSGALGILFAPLLHGDFAHLTSNTIPLLILGGLVLLQGTPEFVKVTIAATLVGGAGTWLAGSSNSLHIGSSVLIFGYFGYLAVRGIFLRSFTSIALSLLVIAIYGWMVFGVLPTQPGVSWQMHLFGAAGGVLAAKEPRPSNVG